MPASYWQGKRAVVTGGSRGLGRALVEALVGQGAQVLAVARNYDRLLLAAEACSGPGQVIPLAADITVPDQVQRIFSEVQQRWQGLDLLINCAGRSARAAIEQCSPEHFHAFMELNFYALVRCTQAALPFLLASRGHVVNIGSLASKVAPRYMGAYPASKFAVAAYSQQLRLELGPRGVHVLLVCPGPIARAEPRSYQTEAAGDLPPEASRPGAGAKVRALDPQHLARLILRACQRRQVELVVPGKARWLFALAQLWPSWGDRLLVRLTSS